jgi:hypothetical protein
VINATAPPPQGHGRLVVDVVEGPTPIQRIRMQARAPSGGPALGGVELVEAYEPLCATTPCVADLPTGNVLLGFPVMGDEGATEVELVNIGAEATVYRRSLSRFQGGRGGAGYVLGIIATALGGTSIMTGTALLPIGLAKDIDGLTIAGGITLGAGAAVLTLGILALRGRAATYRPGSALHFPLGPAGNDVP